MKRTVPATSGVLPGKALTRQDGAHRVHRSWRILWGAALVALLALLPGTGQTRAATPPAFSPAIQRQLQQGIDATRPESRSGSTPLLLTPAFAWSPRLRGAAGETGHDTATMALVLQAANDGNEE